MKNCQSKHVHTDFNNHGNECCGLIAFQATRARRAPARARRRRLRGATACGPTGRMAPGRRRRPRCNSARRHLPREDARKTCVGLVGLADRLERLGRIGQACSWPFLVVGEAWELKAWVGRLSSSMAVNGKRPTPKKTCCWLLAEDERGSVVDQTSWTGRGAFSSTKRIR